VTKRKKIQAKKKAAELAEAEKKRREREAQMKPIYCCVCDKIADTICNQCGDVYCSVRWVGNKGCFHNTHKKGNRKQHTKKKYKFPGEVQAALKKIQTEKEEQVRIKEAKLAEQKLKDDEITDRVMRKLLIRHNNMQKRLEREAQEEVQRRYEIQRAKEEAEKAELEEKARIKRKEQLAKLEGLCIKPKVLIIDSDSLASADYSNETQNQEDDKEEPSAFTFEDSEWQELQIKADDDEIATAK